jgi:hypothetical protein
MSQSVPVKLAEHHNNRGLWQLDATSNSGFAVVRGFSGAPLWDDAGTVVWGMVVEVDAGGRRVAFAIGADRLYDARQGLSPEPAVPEEMRTLREQLSMSNMERDAAVKDLEILRKRLGGVE